ncbi:MAG: 4'-phosphopantetheinyl transferase family protein [Micromonosporaceae bacterium]
MELAPGGVRVWWALLGSVDAALRSRLERLLDPVERERIAGYRRPADQDRFLLGAGIVRLGCAAYLDTAPERIALDRRCNDCGKPHGKVRLSEPGAADGGLRFSVSHSGDWVGVAFARGAEVGLDIEQVRHIDPAELGRLVLAPSETARSTMDFFRYWTRKEAAAKATGDGLRTPLAEIAVSAPDEVPAVRAWPSRADLLPRLSLYDLADRPGQLTDRPGHLAALAVLTPGPGAHGPHRVTECDAAELLQACTN